jgi:hypothetical protein
MARLVVLSFEDNETADSFAADIQATPAYEAKVEGMFALPTQFCDGPHSGGGKLGNAWTRGKKYGWWVCRTCHKPTGHNLPEMFRRIVAQGVNLLKGPEEQDPATPFDEGWGAYREQSIPAPQRAHYRALYE